MKINYITTIISVAIGILIASLIGYWIYHALDTFPARELLPSALALILFCSTTFWSYQAIEEYKKKNNQ